MDDYHNDDDASRGVLPYVLLVLGRLTKTGVGVAAKPLGVQHYLELRKYFLQSASNLLKYYVYCW